MTMPNGAMIPHMSARKRTQTIDALFDAAGGFSRALAWIEKSDENYGEFFKGMWAKGAARPISVEHNSGAGLEEMLEKMDRAANAMTIEGTSRSVDDADDSEPE